MEHTLAVTRGLRLSFFLDQVQPSDFDMFTRHWEVKQFFSSLQVPDPKPTEEYGIFCVDFTMLWTTAHWRELGSLPMDTSREKSLLHPQGNGALQRDCLPKQTLPSSYFSLPSYHIMGDLYLRTLRATHPMSSRDGRAYAEKYWRVNSIKKALYCKKITLVSIYNCFLTV